VTSVTPCITHVEQIPWRPGRPTAWPTWVTPAIRSCFQARGIERPWSHQAQAAELAHAGRDVVVATGTASGKSLAYQLPALTALMSNPKACVLYLAPTKALAADQLESLESLGLPGLRAGSYDGDSDMTERDWTRSHANWILTNPDMLHRGVLPAHARWARMLRRLKYVVVDECHAYRGVFGSHVALVLRRLIRLATMYGAEPVFIFASATSADPPGSTAKLIGRRVLAVTEDGAPRPGADFVLWEPGVLPGSEGQDGAPVRRSAPAEAARMMADLVAEGARTLTFVRSRHGAEQTALSAQRRLSETAPDLAGKVAAYRGGYLPEDRRELERALGSGELMGVASTNALELGVDIAGLDAAVLAGYPGTLASVWQQAGRAGRRASSGRRALVVFVARDDPLDTYLVHHPETVFGRPMEAAITDPTNPFILGPHLACAAAERHLTEADLKLFGGSQIRPVLEDLLARRVLRRRPTGYFWAEPGHPAENVNLRGGGGGQVAIVDQDTARLLGTVDIHRAPAAVHAGAVHLHRGESYVVQDLDLHSGVALVRPDRPEWTTIARSSSTVTMDRPTPGSGSTSATGARSSERRYPGGVRVGSGPVEVTEQVVGYLRRLPGGELLDVIGLDMPRHTLHTRAVWYTVTLEALLAAGVAERDVPGALHAAEHAAIGLLPLFAGCDRWDIGGLSTALHPDTGEPTVIVYDGYPGGAGFADRGHEVLPTWLAAVRSAVADCRCETGCPSCVQSPKCGNGNHPLDKAGAVRVLDTVLDALAAAAAPTGEPSLLAAIQ
jgi:DEAD/DEAH box helicase domain-containing protein